MREILENQLGCLILLGVLNVIITMHTPPMAYYISKNYTMIIQVVGATETDVNTSEMGLMPV